MSDVQVCSSCGEENPSRFRLCGFCGARLSIPAPAEVRRTVTIVFADLKGSTALAERLDPESVREVLNRYFQAMRVVLERHGGTVEKYIGDAVMAVFGLPRLHEDDALRGVRAAWEMQRALDDLNAELQATWGVTLANRIGVNTGEVVAGDAATGQRLVTGDTVNVAARLEQAATEMQTLLGASTERLVRDAVEVEAVEPLLVKGKAEPLAAFRLLRIRSREGVARRQDIPLVGRDSELALLSDSFDRARVDARCRVVTVCADAGMGKTRLVREFINQLSTPATVLRGGCLPYGEGITFWPLTEILRDAAGVREGDGLGEAHAKLLALLEQQDPAVSERLASATGVSDVPFSLEETFWAVRKFLEQLSSRQSLVLALDDLHWAEPTLLDLIEHLAATTDGRVLLICGTRPELFDQRPGWLAAAENTATIVLNALPDSASTDIIEYLSGDATISAAMRTRILDAAQGNPFFVEQMMSMLVDDGLLRVDQAGASQQAGEVSRIVIPSSISALIAARLDRVSDDELSVLQTASVAGVVFPQDAVSELATGDARERVADILSTLAAKVLIRADESDFAGSKAYRFGHVLVRESAYGGLLKRRRAELHERFGDWLERVTGSRSLEYEEIIGYHFEQAHQLLASLGSVDEHCAALGDRAATRLASAGRRSLARGDMPAAANLLHRATALLPDGGAARLSLVPELAETLQELGQTDEADDALRAAMAASAGLNDRSLDTSLRLSWQLLSHLRSPGGWAEAAADQAAQSIAIFTELGDHAGLAKAWRLLASVHGTRCRYGLAEDALRHAVASGQAASDGRTVTRNLVSLAVCTLLGPTPVDEGLSRCAQYLEEAAGDQRAQALVMAVMSELSAMAGDIERARDLVSQSRTMLQDLGGRMFAAVTTLYAGRVEILAGDPQRAEATLRPDVDALQQMGGAYYLSTMAALLSEALLLQERYAEAEELSLVSELAGGDDDPDTQHHWRSVRARAVAHSADRAADAEELAREAVAWAQRTDSPVMTGRALLGLAEVLHLNGRHEEAVEVAEQALVASWAKGDLVSVARAARSSTSPAPLSAVS